ncbi:BAR domain-containing protein [Trichoderma aethiopicum]
MNFTRKIDRARQWAGEKMGAEAKATHTDEFKVLEAEMDIRHEGMERLHKSMNIYTRWLNRHCDALEDRSRSLPLAHLGRTMSAHAAELPDTEYSRRLAAMGNANEQLAELQTTYLDCANATWQQHIEQNLGMMKEYQAARKKLENRRLAYDATMGKIQKAKKDDIRLEEEMRVNKTKFDDSTEDVFQRMQDIREAEQDTTAALTSFLDAELEYHERAANELRRIRKSWAAGADSSYASSQGPDLDRIYSNMSIRSQPAGQAVRNTVINEEYEGAHSPPVARLARTMSTREPPPPPPPPASTRPPIMRSATFETRNPPVIRARAASNSFTRNPPPSVAESRSEDIFDDNSIYSGDNTPSWGERSVSPATSYGSFHVNQAAPEVKKAPPPPVNRAKKPPPPPIPRKMSTPGY